MLNRIYTEPYANHLSNVKINKPATEPLNQHDEYDILLYTTEMTKDLILCLQGLLLGNIRHILLYTMNSSLKWDFNLLIIWTASINSGNERMQTYLYFLNAL